ncbi:MAG TPA: MlaD family protein [Kofleriaceae bacterium]|nr:MlaD family protein [Kofleriaceae bacterium]
MSEINLDELPAPNVHRHKRGRPSAIWIVPIIAIAAGAALAIRTYLRAGPTIHITFESAEGLEVGKSDVRYKNVPVGKITEIGISDDLDQIVATVELNRGAAKLAVSDTKFWVERPRVGVGGVSGLGTLLSGAYIGVDVGTSADTTDHFVGLEKPPGVTHDQRGKKFRLLAHDAGSLAIRSPVYLKRQQVGSITELALTADGKSVEIEIFIDAPYDKDVTETAVFWNSSGMDVTLDAAGLRVDTQSLTTVIAGGIAFGFRDPAHTGAPAADNTRFTLFEDRARAMAKPDTEKLALAIRFDEPLRGVAAATTLIDFQGVQIGNVDDVRLGYDAATHGFYTDVAATVYPRRLGAAYDALIAEGAPTGRSGPEMLQALVGRGLRAQLRSANLLTGSFFIALTLEPNAKKLTVAMKDGAWTVPSERGGTDQIQDQVASIVAKIDRIPFDAIGNDVHDATHAASSLMGHIDRDVVPDTKKLVGEAEIAVEALRDGLAAIRDNVAAPDSPIQQAARTTLDELGRAAFSLRGLGEYLKQHPESLLRGRDSGPEPH